MELSDMSYRRLNHQSCVGKTTILGADLCIGYNDLGSNGRCATMADAILAFGAQAIIGNPWQHAIR